MRIGRGDQQTLSIGDFLHVDRERMGDHSRGDTKAEVKPIPPLTTNVFTKALNNRINYSRLIVGPNHKHERQDALKFPGGLNVDTPNLFAVSFLVSVRGKPTSDYTDKIAE